MSVLLKKSKFDGVSTKELAEQITSKKKCKTKLPVWYNTPQIYYPNKLNIEQTSSEATARYKASIVSGNTLVDITGGLGIDSYYFSTKVGRVFHCEIDDDLSQIAKHNFTVLNQKNITTFNTSGLEFLEDSDSKFDWVFADPSRRHKSKGKVTFLEDYTPDITSYFNLLFEKTENVLLKTAPLLDLTAGLKSLKFVKEIHILAVNNEVKELLWVLKHKFTQDPVIKTVHLKKSKTETFSFKKSDEIEAHSIFSKPLKYLYEPNAALLKAGSFKLIGKHFNLFKLHQHTHLYTSNDIIEFPGRRFHIEHSFPYHKASFKKLDLHQANIATRNFPQSVASIRKKHKIKDGGNQYLFFFKNHLQKLQFLQCNKV